MAAVTLLGSSFTTASGTKTVTATPAVGDLIVIVVAHATNTASVAPSDNVGGIYELLTDTFKNSSADGMSVWARTSLITGGTSTIFTHAPGTTAGGGLAVLKVTGMTRVGVSALGASGVQSDASAGTPAPVLSAVPGSSNPIIAAVFNASNPAGMTSRASYTERMDDGFATPTSGLQIMTRDSGETSDTITWGSASATAFCSIAIELDSSVPASGGIHKFYGPFGGPFHKLI